MSKVAIVGIGRWGKNLVSCFDTLADVAYCYHTGTESNAAWLTENYPEITLTERYEEILENKTIDAVVIATPVGTHLDIARQALKADKDVFVEKPLADTAARAHELYKLAAERDRRLFTGYIFLYAPAMRALNERLSDDPAIQIQALWEKFGTFDVPIAESLASHDIAIGQYLFDEPFRSASVTGKAGLRTEADFFQASFVTAAKRRMTATYDRTARQNRKSVVILTEGANRYEFCDDRLYKLEGNTHREITPDGPEPLTAECRAFLQWLRGGEKPPTAGEFGARVNDTLAEL